MSLRQRLILAISTPPSDYAGVELLERRQAEVAARVAGAVYAHAWLAMGMAVAAMAAEWSGWSVRVWPYAAAIHLYIAMPLHGWRLNRALQREAREQHGEELEELRLLPGVPAPVEVAWDLPAANAIWGALAYGELAASAVHWAWFPGFLASATLEPRPGSPYSSPARFALSLSLAALVYLVVVATTWALGAILCGGAVGLAKKARGLAARREAE